ncbi:MAG: 5-formyltetrahydrofolate cyclo-ligase [Legionellaceae bacterium]|nr:5-formyltetrahydrofolate cyclo-ligase [Legionellaceae bacterium]
MKDTLRKTCLNRRKSLSNEQRDLSSKIICNRVLSLHQYQQAKNIGLYIAFKQEVDLSLLWLNTENDKKSYYFPKLKGKNMSFIQASNKTNFTKNKWGILEPDINNPSIIMNQMLDVIFIPSVAFDESGNRLGMGAGYYDRALANNHSSLLVGIAYDFQKQPQIPAQSWDIKLDLIVTEKTIYNPNTLIDG